MYPAVPAPAVPDANDVLFGSLPRSTTPRTLWKAMRVLLLVSAGISVLVNPQALGSVSVFAVTYGYTLMYSTGLWLTNGYVVDWLNRRYAWTERPLRRLLLTLSVSLGGSVAVILMMNALLLVLHGDPLSRMASAQMYWNVLVPLVITVIISLFNHSRAFFFQWREAAVRAERLEKDSAVARLDSLKRQVDPH